METVLSGKLDKLKSVSESAATAQAITFMVNDKNQDESIVNKLVEKIDPSATVEKEGNEFTYTGKNAHLVHKELVNYGMDVLDGPNPV